MKCIFLDKIIHFFIKLRFTNNVYSNNDDECAICMEYNKEIIFYPCGHFYCCKFCSKKFDLCPICRCRIMYKIKNYYESTN